LSKEEVEKMKAEAKANEATDREARERVDKLNQADSFVFQTEKQLKELGDKIPADKKAPIESALGRLKEAQKAQDIAKIDAAIAEINTAWTAASEHLYKGTQEGGQQSAADAQTNGNEQSNSGKSSENVTDAEFEEVK
jgi:molecular chaperone DnaK